MKQITVCDALDVKDYLMALNPYIKEWVKFRYKRSNLTLEELKSQIEENLGEIKDGNSSEEGFIYTVSNKSFSILLDYSCYVGDYFRLYINDSMVFETDNLNSLVYEWNNRVIKHLYGGIIPVMKFGGKL